jgi:hypothetical protein
MVDQLWLSPRGHGTTAAPLSSSFACLFLDEMKLDIEQIARLETDTKARANGVRIQIL